MPRAWRSSGACRRATGTVSCVCVSVVTNSVPLNPCSISRTRARLTRNRRWIRMNPRPSSCRSRWSSPRVAASRRPASLVSQTLFWSASAYRISRGSSRTHRSSRSATTRTGITRGVPPGGESRPPGGPRTAPPVTPPATAEGEPGPPELAKPAGTLPSAVPNASSAPMTRIPLNTGRAATGSAEPRNGTKIWVTPVHFGSVRAHWTTWRTRPGTVGICGVHRCGGE